MHSSTCWQGNIDLSPLIASLPIDVLPLQFHSENPILEGMTRETHYLLVDVHFASVNPRDISPPFPRDEIPHAVAILDTSKLPLWLPTENTWNLYPHI